MQKFKLIVFQNELICKRDNIFNGPQHYMPPEGAKMSQNIRKFVVLRPIDYAFHDSDSLYILLTLFPY